MMLSIGQLIPLQLQLSDGATDQFPRAVLYNAADAVVATVDLTHVANGRYKSDAQTMPNSAYVAAVYIVYSDSGHTSLASYDRTVDVWQLQTLATAVALATLQTDVTTLGTYIDTEVAAIKAKTDNLPSDPADASDIAAAFGTVNATLSTIAGYLDTEILAIKAKTDNLPSDPADHSLVMAAIAAAQATIDEVAGLLHKNARVDSQTYDTDVPPNMLTARVRVFASAAAANASDPTHSDGADSEIARYSIVATYDVDGNCTSYKLTKDL